MSAWDAARALLDAKLLTLSGISSSKVHWPNRGFTPPTSGLWWKVDLLPVDTAAEIAGRAHEMGIYQVSCFVWAGTDSSTVVPGVDAVCALFDRVLLGTTTKVQCGVPVPAPPLTEPDRFHFPVSIPFQVL